MRVGRGRRGGARRGRARQERARGQRTRRRPRKTTTLSPRTFSFFASRARENSRPFAGFKKSQLASLLRKELHCECVWSAFYFFLGARCVAQATVRERLAPGDLPQRRDARALHAAHRGAHKDPPLQESAQHAPETQRQGQEARHTRAFRPLFSNLTQPALPRFGSRRERDARTKSPRRARAGSGTRPRVTSILARRSTRAAPTSRPSSQPQRATRKPHSPRAQAPQNQPQAPAPN